MIQEFDELSQAEIELMHQAPILVCILIAGADDHIDNREIKKALALTEKNKSERNLIFLIFIKK
ncbi:MAG: hypothetical protein IPJ20_18570 [Flammeovirgaceae bacterium]|nr:hypothetical protein [Flammeovirgaceae bacterium]